MIRILYEDEHLLVVEKPVGVESQETKGFGRDMVSEIRKCRAAQGVRGESYVGVVHRLDQPVRGLMVYGKTKEATAALSRQMAQQGHMDKEYVALCQGKLPQAKGECRDWLLFDRAKNESRIVPEKTPEAKEAVLRYEVLETCAMQAWKKAETIEPAWCYFEAQRRLMAGGHDMSETESVSLVRVQLQTGRHHQIRVQLAQAGAPLLGDVKYGGMPMGSRRETGLCLCATTLAFTHPVTKKKMTFTL